MLWTQADDQRVAALDPLDADLIMSKVPQWNTDGDIHQITSALRHICRISFLDSRNYHELLEAIS
jgi:hypothetical protein